MTDSDSSNSYSESSSSDDEYYGDNGEIFYNEVLNKKYITIKKIGYGAYSSVWLCIDYLTNKFYAIKIQNSEIKILYLEIHKVKIISQKITLIFQYNLKNQNSQVLQKNIVKILLKK